tara:strand:+ start:1313 stop:1801 length:489 start_codon:yes stop_codon:yes gene_type:complete
MTDKKNTPSSHGESKEKETLDSLAIAAFKDLVDSIQSEIKPYLATEGEMVLGNEVSVNRAFLIKINKFLEGRNKNYDLALETITACRKEIEKLRKDKKKGEEELVIHKASIVNLNERVEFLEKEFPILCNKRNEDFHTLTVISEKQRSFIEETNAKLKRKGI